jgi:hypothetical protein
MVVAIRSAAGARGLDPDRPDVSRRRREAVAAAEAAAWRVRAGLERLARS